MEVPPRKKVKPFSVVDLTRSSGSESDDDDIIITGIHHVTALAGQSETAHQVPLKRLHGGDAVIVTGSNGRPEGRAHVDGGRQQAPVAPVASPLNRVIAVPVTEQGSSSKDLESGSRAVAMTARQGLDRMTTSAAVQGPVANNTIHNNPRAYGQQPVLSAAHRPGWINPQLNRDGGLSEGATFKFVPKNKQTYGQVTVKADPAISVNPTDNYMGVQGLKVLDSGAIQYQNTVFHSMQDVKARQAELEQRISKYKIGLEALALREKHRPGRLVELKRNRDQLLRLGLDESNEKVASLQKEMQRLSSQAKENFKKKAEVEHGMKRTKKKLQLFVNTAKPKICALLDEKMKKEKAERLEKLERSRKHAEEMRLQKERSLAEAVANGSQNGGASSSDQLQQLRQVLQNGRYQQMMEEVRAREERNKAELERRRKEEERNAMLRRNPLGLNVYNTDDLLSLLTSVKKQEEQEVEGESNTPNDLSVNLLPHQKRGLKWLEDTEDDHKKCGGILADAMGLGKTVQMIALMLSHRAKEYDEEAELDPQSPKANIASYGSTNLIVAPVSLMNQWKGEMETKVKASANLTVFMYHSMAGRRVTFDQLKKYDVVLVSYGTLSSEFKKHCNIPGFEKSFDMKTPPNMRMVNDLKKDGDYISPFFSKDSKFYRIVLDESQQIKNKLTKASISTACLDGYYRWCLSGTPMQNNVGELFPLLRFLRIKPYNVESNFKKDILHFLEKKGEPHEYGFDTEDGYYTEAAMNKLRILLRSVMLRREKTSLIDGKPILDLPEKTVTKEYVSIQTNEAEATFYSSIEGKAQEQVARILNSRNVAKGDYSYIFVQLLRLRQACLHSELVRIGDRKKGVRYDADGNVVSTANVDSMVKNSERFQPETVRRINEEMEEGITCPICYEEPEPEAYTLFFPCGHAICKECVESYFEQFQEGMNNDNVRFAKCMSCRILVNENAIVDCEVFDKHVNHNQSVEMIRIVMEERNKAARKEAEKIKNGGLEYSPKVKGCIELLEKIWSENPDDKVIIFSNFTSFFVILRKFINDKLQVEPLQYLGSMNVDERNQCVKEFYRNAESKLMLISLKAGNAGLTLTCANHVIIMDPFWNPYVELQAQDRCHRIGQVKPVTVHRLLMQDTVEDRIMKLQLMKETLIEGAIDPQGMRNVSRLSREDIAGLFNIRPSRT
ncbi:RIS1 [Cyberlindnera jadinii]|uniref:RIS1 protein n=1 Tax=Cyberlindnera jadinii (strain ATCC 18201 / CBS 1600 / BCRC 20928 / JCM 3617 / NBRC 0987 / NRRL Y-1542) TaxID=983966 RepID=A0A0H5C4F0_CYBJN|nr:RIS1 [Cyberlindnera jadinii]